MSTIVVGLNSGRLSLAAATRSSSGRRCAPGAGTGNSWRSAQASICRSYVRSTPVTDIMRTTRPVATPQTK